MITASQVKEYAMANGADLAGIGSMEAFEGTTPEHDPRHIAPRAKAIIGLGFRVLRGSLRGVEEETHYYQFPEMGVVHIDEVHAPATLRRVACLLEDHGHEGVVQRSVPDRRPASDEGTNPERTSVFKIRHADPVRPDRPAPDVLMDTNQAAAICGLAEIGLGGFPLTPRFGPLVRFAFVLTDAELEPDDAPPVRLCDRCGLCLAACPGKAIRMDGTLDTWQCAAFRMGADVTTNPFLSEGLMTDHPEARCLLSSPKTFGEEDVKILHRLLDEAYPQVRFGYSPSVCGIGCQRACLAHLETLGVLQDKFIHPFRGAR